MEHSDRRCFELVRLDGVQLPFVDSGRLLSAGRDIRLEELIRRLEGDRNFKDRGRLRCPTLDRGRFLPRKV